MTTLSLDCIPVSSGETNKGPRATGASGVERDLALNGFLRRYMQDQALGRVRELCDYEAAFPGHEEAIRAEWEALQSDALSSSTVGLTEPLEIGPFTAHAELGRGRQGIVYRARDPRLDRDVALKVVPTAGLEPETLERLRREATTLARLEHPGICSVHEMGLSGAVAWIAMPLVQGETLADVLSARVRPDRPWLDRCVKWVRDVALAAHSAHEEGVLHRDLKPGNVMIRSGAGPVILDFGLARDLDPVAATLTRTGDFLGTPAYMAPEQLEPRLGAVAVRSDVWALGAILFECCTLTRPFGGATVSELSRRVTDTAAPAAHDVNRAVPRDLSLIIARALERDAFRRYDTAAALADDLDRWLEGLPVSARPVGLPGRLARWARRRPALAAVAGALVATLALASAGLISQNLVLRSAETDLTKALASERERRAEAEAEAQRAERVLGFLETSIIRATDGRTNAALKRAVGGGENVDIRTLLTHAAENIGDRFSAYPGTECMIRDSLGRALEGQGLHEQVINVMEPALPLAAEAFGAQSPEMRLLKARLGHSLLFSGQAARAVEVLEELVSGYDPGDAETTEEMLAAEGELALAYQQVEKSEKAIACYRSILRRGEGKLAPHSEVMVEARSHLALVLWTTGATDEACRELSRVVEVELDQEAPRAHVLCQNLRSLATMQWKGGDKEESVTTLDQALKYARSAHGDAHPNTMDIRRDKAMQYRLRGMLAEAVTQLESNIQFMEGMAEPPLDRILAALRSASEMLLKLKRHGDAARCLTRMASFERRRGSVPAGRRATTALAIVSAWLGAGEKDAALAALDVALPLLESLDREQLTPLLGPLETVSIRGLELWGKDAPAVLKAAKLAADALEAAAATDRATALRKRIRRP